MKIRSETGPRTLWVIPEGRLDFAAAPALQRELDAALAGARAAAAAVIIDGSTLDYVSSAGLRVFLGAARAAQRAGLAFALCALRPPVREVFELSGFDRLMTVHADREAAAGRPQPEAAGDERRFAVSAEAERLPLLTQFLKQFWADQGLPATRPLPFELALEEVFMNVVLHGSPPGRSVRVELSLRLSAGSLTMTLEDDGPEFNPLSLPPPDVTASLAERRVGGYGVFLVREMMDTVSYLRIGPRNQLSMTRRIAP